MAEPLSMDQVFVKKFADIVIANIHDENFGVNKLAEVAGMSRVTVYRKIRSIRHQSISHTPKEYRKPNITATGLWKSIRIVRRLML